MPQATLPQINKPLEAADLERLCSLQGTCITVLLPGYKPGAASTPDATPLKHLLRTAVDTPALRKMGKEANALLEPLQELAETPDLKSGGEGLALFSALGFTAGYRASARVAPKLVAAKHPFIRPLLADAYAPAEMFALALSRKHPRLFRCHHRAAEELDFPPGVPKSLAEAGEFDQPDHDLANRSASGTSTGSRFAVRFGTLSDRESAPEYLHHYFALVDRGLSPLVKAVPVLLMGVAAEIAAFRNVRCHLNLMETQFAGNADFATADDAAGKAREAAFASYRLQGENMLREFREMPDRNRACTGLSRVLAAADQGRVHQLLLAEETQIPAQQRKNMLDGEDVLNAIAVQTIRKSGHVFTLPAEVMGDAAPVAAILRY
jgi:hypothetical protein